MDIHQHLKDPASDRLSLTDHGFHRVKRNGGLRLQFLSDLANVSGHTNLLTDTFARRRCDHHNEPMPENLELVLRHVFIILTSPVPKRLRTRLLPRAPLLLQGPGAVWLSLESGLTLPRREAELQELERLRLLQTCRLISIQELPGFESTEAKVECVSEGSPYPFRVFTEVYFSLRLLSLALSSTRDP